MRHRIVLPGRFGPSPRPPERPAVRATNTVKPPPPTTTVRRQWRPAFRGNRSPNDPSNLSQPAALRQLPIIRVPEVIRFQILLQNLDGGQVGMNASGVLV
jgi:hypothetical protein